MAGVQEVLGERYELLDVLGRGGMGVVYRARDRVLERIVAVKVLPLDRAQDPTFVARFEREALAVARLSHRNIVAVFDSGTDGDTRFIVMEYLPGQSLAEIVRERGALPPQEAVAVAAQVAAALAAAHRTGIIHRDIKPANIMVDEHGHVKVLDFGIARLTAGSSLTQTATVLGSAPYLAPELSRGAAADGRSDIYALGCVLYELLTGQPPFSGELPAAVVHQHLSVMPRRPEQLHSGVPQRLGTLTLQMLAKAPDQRPQDAGEMVTMLPATLAGAGTGATRTLPPADTTATAVPGALSEAATAAMAGAAAPTLPLASARASGPEPTRVMPRRLGETPSTAAPSAARRFGIAAVVLILALALTVLALTTGSAPRATADHKKHTAIHKPANTQTQTTQATSTTASVTTPGPATHQPPPHSQTPPPQQPGQPHGHHGQPPGQAHKQGPGDSKDQNDQ
jgi:serine/threonine-protein kinase